MSTIQGNNDIRTNNMLGTILAMDSSKYADVPNLLTYFINEDQMKALYILCLSTDIADNNDKAEIVRHILGPDFVEIGTGTNRMAFRKNSFVVKIALDRRGLIDNHTEFKRSAELPEIFAKTYETNYLVNIAEYVELLDQSAFLAAESRIKEILSALSDRYLFEDLGFQVKNFCNWGARTVHLRGEEAEEFGDLMNYVVDICILDYGYMYPLYGQKEILFRCPKCNHNLKWNSNYTQIACSNHNSCGLTMAPFELRKYMDLTYEEIENKEMEVILNATMPDLSEVEKSLAIKKNKGGA